MSTATAPPAPVTVTLALATGTTEGLLMSKRRPRAGTPAPAVEPHAPPGVLRPADIAQIWTDEARKSKPDRNLLRVQTVWSYLKESRVPGGRYLDNPMPMPDGYTGRALNGPWWHDTPQRRQELRDWWHSRAGNVRDATGRFTKLDTVAQRDPSGRIVDTTR